MKKIFRNNKHMSLATKCLIIFCIILSFLSVYNIYKSNTKLSANSTPENTVLPNPNTEIANPFEGLTLSNDDSGVPVLCYHSISDDTTLKNPIVVSTTLFREHLQVIKDNGYTTLTIEQLNNYITNKQAIPEKSVVITFDDAYLDNYTLAFPILKEFNMTATIFAISDFLNTDPYMTTSNIKEMITYGIDIQSHTSTHSELAKLSYENQLKELSDSKKSIETLTNKPVLSIAYPFGSYNENTLKAATAAGYSMAFTVKKGFSTRIQNHYELSRILIDYTYKAKDIKKSISK